MSQKEFDLAEWLVYEKAVIMADIEPRVKRFMSTYDGNPFKEAKYISDLRDVIRSQIIYRTLFLKGNEWGQDEIYTMFDEEPVRLVIDRHYIREYLYD